MLWYKHTNVFLLAIICILSCLYWRKYFNIAKKNQHRIKPLFCDTVEMWNPLINMCPALSCTVRKFSVAYGAHDVPFHEVWSYILLAVADIIRGSIRWYVCVCACSLSVALSSLCVCVCVCAHRSRSAWERPSDLLCAFSHFQHLPFLMEKSQLELCLFV